MPNRTFVIGDIHGGYDQLAALMRKLPPLRSSDTLVFLGDYVDRGPRSADVVAYLRKLPQSSPVKLVTLRGNHEDGWLRVLEGGWPEFLVPPTNGCFATLFSFLGRKDAATLAPGDMEAMVSGSFFPPDVVAWLRGLPTWYEDEHAIYVHAGLARADGRWMHPKELDDPHPLLWSRSGEFFRTYDGKLVVCGHTPTETLPNELSTYTPDDPADAWVRGPVLAIDTGCGKEGFLTAVELPGKTIYESR